MKKKIIIAIIVLVVLVAGATVWFLLSHRKPEYKHIQSTDAGSTLKTEVFFEHSFENEITVVGDNVVVYTDNYINWYSKKASLVASSLNRLNNIGIKAEGEYLFVYEEQGKDFELYKRAGGFGKKEGLEPKWTKSVNEKILNASVNKNGYTAVIRDFAGYESGVEVYDEIGRSLFCLCKAEEKIIDVQVTDDNKGVLLTMINTNGCALDTIVVYTDIHGKEKWRKTVDSDLLYLIKHTGEKKLACAGRDKLHIVSEKENIEYKFNQINALEVSSNGNIVVCANNSDGDVEGNVINIYNSKGKQKGGLILDSELKSLAVYNDLIAINFGRKIIVVNEKGNVKGELLMDKEIVDVEFLDAGQLLVKESDRMTLVKL